MNMNQPSAEHLSNLYPDRTSLDIRNIYPWANQSYYKIDEDNPDSYRTVYLKVNPFNNNQIQPLWSNSVIGIPPEGMKELNPQLMKAIGRTSHLANAPF